MLEQMSKVPSAFESIFAEVYELTKVNNALEQDANAQCLQLDQELASKIAQLKDECEKKKKTIQELAQSKKLTNGWSKQGIKMWNALITAYNGLPVACLTTDKMSKDILTRILTKQVSDEEIQKALGRDIGAKMCTLLCSTVRDNFELKGPFNCVRCARAKKTGYQTLCTLEFTQLIKWHQSEKYNGVSVVFQDLRRWENAWVTKFKNVTRQDLDWGNCDDCYAYCDVRLKYHVLVRKENEFYNDEKRVKVSFLK